MIFQQYIDNPMGKGSGIPVAQREAMKAIYTKKWDELYMREAGKIDSFLYYDEKANIYVAWIKIPSEVVPKFYYDVLIEFTSDDPAKQIELGLQNYNVRFYSNDPSFVFTYLKVFKDNDMFIMWLKDKAPKQALKKDPVEKNPYKIPGYVKSLYFAWLFMNQKSLFSKKNYTFYGSKLNKKNVCKMIMHADKKIELRQKLGQKVAEEKRKGKVEEYKKTAKKMGKVYEPNTNINKKSPVGKVSKITPRNSNIKKTSPVGKVNKITRRKKSI